MGRLGSLQEYISKRLKCPPGLMARTSFSALDDVTAVDIFDAAVALALRNSVIPASLRQRISLFCIPAWTGQCSAKGPDIRVGVADTYTLCFSFTPEVWDLRTGLIESEQVAQQRKLAEPVITSSYNLSEAYRRVDVDFENFRLGLESTDADILNSARSA